MMSRIPTVVETDIDDAIVKSLNSYIYHNVHSRPYSEYRHNVKLFPLFQEPKVNIFHIASSSIRLPASGRWFLYTVEATGIVSLKFPCDYTKWVCLGDYIDSKTKERISGYCSSSGIDIRLILSNYNRCIARHGVWMIKNPKANNFIFAISEAVIDEMLGLVLSKPSEIDLNIYYHKEDEYFKVVGYNCEKLSDRNTFYSDCIAESEYKKIIFVDGRELVPKNLTDIPEGSYGEIIYDSSIVGIYEIDFISYGDLVYFDDNQNAKLLCHIPKEYNPNNEILNHRNCDFYIHCDKSSTDYYRDGIYINRTGTESQFYTITHNDFSINRQLILKYTALSGDELTGIVKVVVRDHNKGFKLYKEPNFIRELYQLDDDTIIENLMNRTGNAFWAAKTIEQSKWSYFIDNYLEGVTADNMTDCVTSLGYLNSANVVCSRVQHVLISNELSKVFYIPIPICYLNTEKLICHIFIDGLLQDNDHFTYTKSKQFLKIKCDQYVPWTIGSRITIEIFECIDYQAKVFEPTYSLTTDTVFKYGTVYYTRSGEEDNYVYTRQVFTKVGSDFPKSTKITYYEYNASTQTYTATTDTTVAKKVYYIRNDNTGVYSLAIATYGASIPSDTFYINTTQPLSFTTNSGYVIFRCMPLTSSNTISDKYIYNRFTADMSYKQFIDTDYEQYVTTVEDPTNDNTIVTVTNPGCTVLIVSKYAYAKIYGVERHLKELNYDIWCSHLLSIDANQFDTVKFVATSDTEAQVNKAYYIRKNNKYYVAHVITSDTSFVINKTYYLYKDEEFVEASVTPGTIVPANTYYERIEEGDEIVQSSTCVIYETTTTSTDEKITIPYLNTDRVMLTYLNGRELISNLDCKDYQIKTSREAICGQFVVLQNVDYLKLVSNIFEVFIVNERLTTQDVGFLTADKTETILSEMSFCSNVGQVFVDGIAKQYCDDPEFYVEINEAVRKGSSYKIRSLIPTAITDRFDPILDIDNDTRTKVIDYVNQFNEADIEVTPITRSHHIYSTFLQTVCEQILRKKIKYDSNWSDERIKASLAKYLDMQEFDIALSDENIAVTTKDASIKAPSKGLDFRFVDVLPSYRLERLEDSDLTITEERPLMLISNSSIEDINGNYICINPGIEYMRTETTARHINENAYKRWENNAGCYIEHSDNYWRLYDTSGVECYRAFDNKGIKEIWNLNWESVGTFSAITINVVYVEVNTSNEFPIHRLQFTYTVNEHAYLTRVANMFIKQDIIKDGMTI